MAGRRAVAQLVEGLPQLGNYGPPYTNHLSYSQIFCCCCKIYPVVAYIQTGTCCRQPRQISIVSILKLSIHSFVVRQHATCFGRTDHPQALNALYRKLKIKFFL